MLRGIAAAGAVLDRVDTIQLELSTVALAAGGAPW
jgi:hypothetical protein